MQTLMDNEAKFASQRYMIEEIVGLNGWWLKKLNSKNAKAILRTLFTICGKPIHSHADKGVR